MKSYDTETEREDYILRLFGRASETIAREAPPGAGHEEWLWAAIAPKSIAVMRESIRFREGRSTKEELDRRVLALLGEWRTQFARYRSEHPSPATGSRRTTSSGGSPG